MQVNMVWIDFDMPVNMSRVRFGVEALFSGTETARRLSD